MEKKYCKYLVKVSFFVYDSYYVTAENEEEARTKAEERARTHSLNDMIEQSCRTSILNKSVAKDLDRGLDYVRDNLKDYEIVRIHALIAQCVAMQITPSNITGTTHVVELLEEYARDNDLPDDWWEEYGDIDFIMYNI